MNWTEAFAILQPLADDDYVGGAWPPIRKAKCKALFELAKGVKDGVIVELGAFRGLGAIALKLGAPAGTTVFTIDTHERHKDFIGFAYSTHDRERFHQNNAKANAGVQLVIGDARALAEGWDASIGLLVWDLGEAVRLKDDIAAWLPHLTADGIVAVKDLETVSFGREGLEALGLELDREFPAGAVYAYRRAEKRENSVSSVSSVFWIVDGDKYVAEAQRSAASVAKHMPHLQQTIYQPEKRVHKEWFIESTRLLVNVLEGLPDGAKVLWLDSDTYMLEPVNDLLDNLDPFDLILAHAPGHKTADPQYEIPDFFPEFQIGAIAMRNWKSVRDLWYSVYTYQRADHIETDQAALRLVLWLDTVVGHTVQYAVMPCEYNLRFQFGGQVRDRVKILHGHADSAETYEAIGKSVNAGYVEGYQIPPRLWSPDVLR